MDKRKHVLLDALKIGALDRSEMRLYRRGKLPGLFAQRTRVNAEIADQAVKDGLLEVTRIETTGKATVEWVRVTPQGVNLLVESESPARALEELRATLAVHQQSLPAWMAQVHARMDELAKNFENEISGVRQQLDQLTQRVVAAIERLESAPAVPTPPETPWADATRAYLEQRRQVGLGTRCPLADLFVALKEKHAELTVKEFHACLRRMHETNTITLLPSTGNGDAPGPEYALLDGPALYYYVTTGVTKSRDPVHD